jgi:hypothetical protein
MRDLDLFLRGHIFGPLAWWIDRHWGYSKFQIARFCTAACLFMMALYFVLTTTSGLGLFVLLVAWLPWSFLCTTRYFFSIPRDEALERVRPDVYAQVADLTWLPRLIQLFVFMTFDVLVLGFDIWQAHVVGLQWLIIVPLRLHMTAFAVGTYITTVSPPPQRQEKMSPLAQPVPHAG